MSHHPCPKFTSEGLNPWILRLTSRTELTTDAGVDPRGGSDPSSTSSPKRDRLYTRNPQSRLRTLYPSSVAPRHSPSRHTSELRTKEGRKRWFLWVLSFLYRSPLHHKGRTDPGRESGCPLGLLSPPRQRTTEAIGLRHHGQKVVRITESELYPVPSRGSPAPPVLHSVAVVTVDWTEGLTSLWQPVTGSRNLDSGVIRSVIGPLQENKGIISTLLPPSRKKFGEQVSVCRSLTVLTFGLDTRSPGREPGP